MCVWRTTSLTVAIASSSADEHAARPSRRATADRCPARSALARAQPRGQPLPARSRAASLSPRAHLTGANSGDELVGDEQRLQRERRGEQPPVARRSTASGSGHRMYQASSHVLVTEIASSAQPEAATQS